MAEECDRALSSPERPLTWNEMDRILSEEVDMGAYADRLYQAGARIPLEDVPEPDHYRVF